MSFVESYHAANALLATVAPATPFFQENAFLVYGAFAALVVVTLYFVDLSLGSATDSWKLLLGVGADALKLLGLFNPWLALLSAFLGSLSFIVMGESRWLRWPFAAASIGAAVAVLPGFYGTTAMGVLLALAPVNTVLFFVSSVAE